MTLSKVLEGVTVTKLFQTMYGKMVVTHEVGIRGIQYDSRHVSRDELFVAIRGTGVDGHAFINAAIGKGARAVVMENDEALPDSLFMHAGVVKVVVPDSRKALAEISANFYGHPSRQLALVGVTGTNGKTTTTHLIRSILEARGDNVGLIGTIEYAIGGETIPATHTTPESLELNRLLATMVSKGCSTAVMEVSSHALQMSRVHGLAFSVAAFTNLTQDHLDFHGTMERYLQAKQILFSGLDSNATAITNVDDESGMRIIEGTKARRLSYGTNTTADVQAGDIRMDVQGSSFTIAYGGEHYKVVSSLTGRFNVANMTAAYAAGVALGVPAGAIRTGIERLRSVRGRFEQIISPRGWTAVVDYAHTPDALENCLRTIHDLLPDRASHRIITVFGCGGNRDRGKRPAMGAIASSRSDVTIITSDNPRKEDPHAIMEEISTGVVRGTMVLREADRRKAIVMALEMAREGDVILIAGKGHEDYQVIGETKVHFDDREEVEQFIGNHP
jgi:UDP-N-acetylmuramoyl-L-alanyl-D-glutamate--2,6-diaminopimelate ligase